METMRLVVIIFICLVKTSLCWYPWLPPPPPPPSATPPPPINPFEELKSFFPHLFFPNLHHDHHDHWEIPTTAAPPTESPFYNFKYEVNSPLTGDIKSHTEERDGNVVRGEYSLLEPDGSIRTVKYVADASGFNADVVKVDPATTPASLPDPLIPWHLHFPLLEQIHLPENREGESEKRSAKDEETTQKPQK